MLKLRIQWFVKSYTAQCVENNMSGVELIEDLVYSEQYAQYIMDHGDNEERVICNGDTLLEAMEDEYLFDDFLKSIGVKR